MIVGGYINDNIGPKWSIFIGGIFFGGGVFVAGCASSPIMVVIGYGVLMGLGMGLVYGCTIGNSIKFFPDKAGLVGGLGIAPSGNIGDDYRIYEAVHGSAPDIASKGIANPSSLILAFAMMLEALNKQKEAQSLREALAAVVEEGKYTTPDIGGQATKKEFIDAIIDKL